MTVRIEPRGSALRRDEYASPVLFIPFKQTAHESLRATTGAETVRGKFAEHAIHLLAQEAHGEELQGYEKRWVDHLTQSVKEKAENFTRP